MHPTIQLLVVKNLLVGGVIYYWHGEQALLWWLAITALLYGIFALNSVLRLEENSRRDETFRTRTLNLAERDQD
jgi:hypothetical protein